MLPYMFRIYCLALRGSERREFEVCGCLDEADCNARLQALNRTDDPEYPWPYYFPEVIALRAEGWTLRFSTEPTGETPEIPV